MVGLEKWLGAVGQMVYMNERVSVAIFAGEGVGSPRRGHGGRRNRGARIGDGKLCTGK